MMDHAFAPGHGVERRRPLAAPDQVGIALVLEDHDAVFGGELQQLGAARLAHDGAGRILHRRDRVDVLGLDTLLLQLLELLLQHVEPQAFVVERDADRVDAELDEPGERAAVGLLLDQDGVALADQQAVDQVEALHRARRDQDLVGRAVDTGMALELADQELAQRPVAQRSAVQPVGRERGALALQHRRRRGDQGVDRHMLGVVVAADEIVLGKAVPFDGGSGRAGRQQGREIESARSWAVPRLLAPNCWANPPIRNSFGRSGHGAERMGVGHVPRLAPARRRGAGHQGALRPAAGRCRRR